ncbi:MAG: hypothetical protein AUI15_18625 [Actinobacteria bacterium 13_2_20CM_2_66_6]|nr:MAG: hypothetical protein AUI15_18625 [Actinobacteria bacterium 13_2_20CM_2_66_6]
MRLAAVDIGSNTVHVLVADVVRDRLEEVAHYVEMPELGPQVARTGAIGSRGKAAIRALRSVLARASAHHYDHLIAGATEAIRVARDGEEFARQAGDAIGTPVHVISAHREAELSFLGVASRHAARREWVMVDLGGASTEVAIGRAREMVRWASLPVGSGVLASTYLADPPKPEERARMRRAALLTSDDLLQCEKRLDGARALEVSEKVGLPVNRVKAMRAGVEVLLLMLDWYGLAVLHISHEGLRHGMLLAYLERGGAWNR